VAERHLHAQLPLTAHGFMGRCKKIGSRGDPKQLPPLFIFLIGVDLQNTQKRNKQVCSSPDLLSDFSLFKFVNLCLLSSSQLAFFLLVADLAVVMAVAVDESANA